MAWIITLVSGVSTPSNDYVVGVIEDKGAAIQCGQVLLAYYNREHPEYSHFDVSEVFP